jgi:hypothetical protein
MAAMEPFRERPETEILVCIRCEKARFPDPKEQCYKFGGLICTVDQANVGKYDRCRFGYRGQADESKG